MTENQKIFADEYLFDRNATRAYLVAYPNVKRAAVASANGSRLLRNANIEKYISDRLDEIHSEKTADAKEVMEYLTAVMRKESRSEVVIVEGTGDGCSEARLMEKPPDEKEAMDAAKTLAKILGMANKMEVDADMTLNITIDYGESDPGESDAK